MFVDNYEALLLNAMNELPENWDALHLAGQDFHNARRTYSSRLDRLYKGLGAYAYVINRKFMPKLIEVLKKEETQVDWHYAWLMPESNWFKTKKCLVHHLAGYSDIMCKYVDYSFLNK